MEELNFLGIGSAFNTKLGNTSAFITKNKSLLLIDCGGTVFHRLQELKILDVMENIYIVITHTHPDHVGSLGEVIFYSYYLLGRRATIFFPNKGLIESFLSNIGVSSEMYVLESMNKVNVEDVALGDFGIEFLSVTHVDTIPAYGFVMKIDGGSFYYSGDANDISYEIIEGLRNGAIDRIYQDTCGLDYEGNSHTSLRKLSEKVSIELRNRIYCMHLDKHISEDEILERGFNIAKMY